MDLVWLLFVVREVEIFVCFASVSEEAKDQVRKFWS